MGMDVEMEIREIQKLLVAINTKLDATLDTQNDHEDRLRRLENVSGKRWESLVADVVKIVVAALIGFAFARVGL